jgi:CBS-domain-containing membrane protein
MTVNIHQVAENLRNTIKGKEAYLAEVSQARGLASRDEDNALYAVQEFLKININELKVILFDVEKCCEKATLDSWIINPERMGQ